MINKTKHPTDRYQRRVLRAKKDKPYATKKREKEDVQASGDQRFEGRLEARP
jgi:hypothetical protein